MKRYLFPLLLCVLLLSGCAPQNAAPPAQPAAARADIPTLIWWTVGPEPVDCQLGLDNINRYLEANLGLRLDLRMLPWQDLMKKSLMICNAGEYFDIMFVDSENYNKFSTWGAFADVTDTLRATAPELWEFIPDPIWAGAKIGGRIYAIPTYKDVALTQYWVFDKAMLEESGVDIGWIQDWEDLDVALTYIKATRGKDFYPLQMTRNDIFNGVFNGYDSFSSGLPVIGVKTDDPQRKVLCVLEDPAFLSRLGMLRKWYVTGVTNPDANVTLACGGPQPFFSGVGWPGAEQVWARTKGAAAYATKRIYGPVLSCETIQGSMNAISSQSAYPKEAMLLLERINLDPVLRDMFAYGVEGTHFEYVSDKVVRQLNNRWNVEVFAQGTFFNMSTTTQWPANQWELVKAQNAEAVHSVLLGYNMDISELSTEISACKAIWDKYRVDLLTGASDPDLAVPACLSELRRAGLDIILSEAQKQIDSFAAP
jgi:putative aldouronate transport system substrate-binding protein